jgi:hypothetical protein
MSLLLLFNAAPSTVFLTDNANTTVLDLGDNLWRVTKDTGTGSANNASAIQTAGFDADFSIRVTRGGPNALFNSAVGVSLVPTTDNDYTSIDYNVIWDTPSAKWYYRVGPTYGGINFAETSYLWIWRTGTTVGFGTGANLAAAQASPAATATTSANLFFDSSLYYPDDIATVLLDGDTAVSNDIAGTSSLTFAPTASISGRGDLTAASSLTFAPTVVALVGRGNLTAASSLTFAPSVAVTGKGNITATSGLTFAPSASVVGLGSLSGASTLTFAPTGSLTGIGTITGASSITFSPTGSLAGFGDISGSTSIEFAPTGSISGIAYISGITTLTFAAQCSIVTPEGPFNFYRDPILTGKPRAVGRRR